MPKSLVVELSDKLRRQLEMNAMFAVIEMSPEATCVDEPCQLAEAQKLSADHVLHTRLVQYADNCVLVGLLYSVSDGKSEWASAQSFLCDQPSLEQAVSVLSTAFARREAAPVPGPVYAVVPIQHKLKDLAWASESFSEYLTTILAEAGLTVVAASAVAANLEKDAGEIYQACPDKSCALNLAEASQAQKVVTTKIAQKKRPAR